MRLSWRPDGDLEVNGTANMSWGRPRKGQGALGLSLQGRWRMLWSEAEAQIRNSG
jgi:hypothetical protein